jgi:hypothetical protein
MMACDNIYSIKWFDQYVDRNIVNNIYSIKWHDQYVDRNIVNNIYLFC